MGLVSIEVTCILINFVEVRTLLIVIHYHNNLVVLTVVVGGLFQMSKMLLIIMLPLFMLACSGDDDPVSIDSYLIGTWHTFKATVYGNGQNVDIEITKTGEYSASYSEVTFEKDGKAIMRGWVTDEKGLSHWMEEQYTYTVNGDIVTVKNPSETEGTEKVPLGTF